MKNIRGLTPAFPKGKEEEPIYKGLGFEKLKILCILLTMIMVAAFKPESPNSAGRTGTF